MIIGNNSKCPDCGGILMGYDKVKRIVRTKGGLKKWIPISRFRCKQCKKTHRQLTDTIFPYKHYESEIIKGVIEGLIDSCTLGFEDYPSEMTMMRWTRKKQLPL